ncbi:MAG: CHAT domain-containing protein, partial [Bacteroidota bacterium]
PKLKPNEVNQNMLAFSFGGEAVVEDNNYLTFRDLQKDLPGTSREVSAIADILDGVYYYGEMATETSFKTASKQYAMIHLAIHGVQDENFPENSYLQFAEQDSLNDGRLHAYELYDCDLNADMAVLTACHSGGGKVVAGEGMMSIGRAFSYAGVNSILISRWEVPDVSTPYIMKYFYQALKKGMRKSEALAYAQKEFLAKDADNITKAPFYWAGFYIVGDDSPIRLQESWFSVSKWVAVLLVFALVLLALSYQNRKGGFLVYRLFNK